MQNIRPLTTIRDAQKPDFDAMMGLLAELNAAENLAITPDAQALHAAFFATVRPVALQALVAQAVDKTIVGAVFFYPGYDILTASAGYHLGDIVVGAAWRRQGIGSAIFRALAARTLSEGKSWLSLTVLRGNHAAKHFYAHHGMTQVAVDFYAMGERAMRALTE